MELLNGGDLFDYISNRSDPVPEPVVKHIMRQIFRALSHLHARNIAHRDLKPENILLTDSNSPRPTIKLTDFGLAGRLNNQAGIGAVDDEELERFEYGTVGYMAPEIIMRKRHHTAVDMWACGCILYVLLCGRKPFSGKSHEEVCLKSSTGNFYFPQVLFKDSSQEAISLTRSLLQLRPHLRLTAQAALCHDWFKEDKAWLGREVKPTKRTPAFRFRAAIYAVMFTHSWCESEPTLASTLSPSSLNMKGLNRIMSNVAANNASSTTLFTMRNSLRPALEGSQSLRGSRRLSVLSNATSNMLELGGRNTSHAE
mmetsp:Transcript_8078/g.24340  ORF Transcript_8078/g.24340 Transcript_8078/m.24340 type:complete len:312 (-) Transcript_8078:88-1023(-)